MVWLRPASETIYFGANFVCAGACDNITDYIKPVYYR